MVGQVSYSARRPRLVTVLDVGTSKVCCLIAKAHYRSGEEPTYSVIGFGLQRSQGVKSGMIVDMDAAERSIRAAVDQAERMAGVIVEDVFLTVTCGRVKSDNLSASVAISGESVQNTDIGRVLAAGQNYASGNDRFVLHTVATGYRLDESEGVSDPRGMIANRLSVDIHCVAADERPLKNLVLCVERCHLGVAGLAAASFASGHSIIAKDEAEIGVICIDLGAGTTTVSIFADGSFVFADALAIGGHHVTVDLARSLSVSLDQAERIKTLYGSAFATPSDEREIITLPAIDDDQAFRGRQVSKADIAEIVRPRIEELFEMIAERLASCNGDELNRVVLTGGASLMTGLPELAERVLRKRVRLGTPDRTAGLPDHVGPAHAASVGLLMRSDSVAVEFGPLAPRRVLGTGTGYLARVGQWIRESF